MQEKINTVLNIKRYFNYCSNKSHQIRIGNILLGGSADIRVQSMTNTPTSDIYATINQCKALFDKGADMVRITAPTQHDAKSIIQIAGHLQCSGYTNPIIADVHYSPKVAEQLASFIEKIRINPGNYIDKNTGNKTEFTNAEYSNELNKIQNKLLPLIKICKKHNTSIRIGTNHGSLSDRILSRYGNTPEGMVESTMEFLRIFVNEDFFNIAISLKSSNTRVMIQANRLVLKQMELEKLSFPLHLGVTEAGDGADGRIKSAIGIGTLLGEGIGDTIRVSLTESPENEIPVCNKIINYIKAKKKHEIINYPDVLPFNPYSFSRRKTIGIFNIGSENAPIVIADLSNFKRINKKDFLALGYSPNNNIYIKSTDQTPDYIYIGSNVINYDNYIGIEFISDYKTWKTHYSNKKHFHPLILTNNFTDKSIDETKIKFLQVSYSDLTNEFIEVIKKFKNLVLLTGSNNLNFAGEQRALIAKLYKNNCKTPVIPFHSYIQNDIEDFQVQSSCDFGSLFIDGLVDGIMISSRKRISIKDTVSVAFGILQASRVRITKTEFISCPGCGRTLFDLQTVSAEIQEKTSHLKGLKIGIMGCIVNGPGEMADADYGYVGTGKGKVSLYKKQTVVKKNIPTSDALNELIKLIKENGDWSE